MIYIHIPFCKQACHYCNFHFSTSMKYKDEVLNAILHEIELQKNYLSSQTIKSIYFGGGTPSLLTADEIKRIFSKLAQFYTIEKDVEITLEANPDDLTPSKIKDFASTPINRFSIGIQSFHDVDLKYMNRAHNAEEAQKCVKYAQDNGFSNITVDLIYGTPTMNNDRWHENIQTTFDLGVPHVSCYALTVEPNTALDHFVKKKKMPPVDEEQSAQQFEILIAEMEKNGFDHYEISNFAQPDHYAKHNSNYWKGVSYLGLGPSAHSFNGQSRQWNIAHNMKYIKAINSDQIPFEIEHLSTDDLYNEYVMTGLRTIWGMDLARIEAFGARYKKSFLKTIQPFLDNGIALQNETHYMLSKQGKLMADGVASALFI